MFPPSLEPEPASVFRRANYILGILLIDRCFSFAPKAVRLLPVASLPEVDYPTISVSASLAGASPETMADSVATPLIKQFQTISGI